MELIGAQNDNIFKAFVNERGSVATKQKPYNEWVVSCGFTTFTVIVSKERDFYFILSQTEKIDFPRYL